MIAQLSLILPENPEDYIRLNVYHFFFICRVIYWDKK